MGFFQRGGHVEYHRGHYARDRGHYPDFSLEAHQNGHHGWDDTGFGRKQAHLITRYLQFGQR